MLNGERIPNIAHIASGNACVVLAEARLAPLLTHLSSLLADVYLASTNFKAGVFERFDPPSPKLLGCYYFTRWWTGPNHSAFCGWRVSLHPLNCPIRAWRV